MTTQHKGAKELITKADLCLKAIRRSYAEWNKEDEVGIETREVLEFVMDKVGFCEAMVKRAEKLRAEVNGNGWSYPLHIGRLDMVMRMLRMWMFCQERETGWAAFSKFTAEERAHFDYFLSRNGWGEIEEFLQPLDANYWDDDSDDETVELGESSVKLPPKFRVQLPRRSNPCGQEFDELIDLTDETQPPLVTRVARKRKFIDIDSDDEGSQEIDI